MLRGRAKTSPHAGNPAPSPGPYYPSSPDDKTTPAQSPLTLDKVTAYAFDDQSVVSFCDYQPEILERIDGEDLETSEEGGTSCNQKKDKAGTTDNHRGRYDADDCSKGNRNTVYNGTAELREKHKYTKQKKLVEKTLWCEKVSTEGHSSLMADAEEDTKNSVEMTKFNTTFTNENSITNLLEPEKLQTMLNENITNQTPSCFDGEFLAWNKTAGQTLELETRPENENFAQLSNSNAFSEDHANISEKIKGKRYVASTAKRSPADTTPVAWGKSDRKSIVTGLTSAQHTGTILVQTSSVCVTIPLATDWNHNPVSKLRRHSAMLIMNPMFDWFITSVIFLNTVVMAMEYHGMNRKFANTLDNINLVSSLTNSSKCSWA